MQLADYLTKYGRTLGEKAIASLEPLHRPGLDPLPDMDQVEAFNPNRTPFEPQHHVIAAASKMLDEVGSGFIVGEMGCIAGESIIYDPVANARRRVDEIEGQFNVIAFNEKTGNYTIARAHKPFIKGTRELYRVELSNGKSFIATDHHRVLTRDGWRLVSELAVSPFASGASHLRSTGEFSLEECLRDVEHLSHRPSDSPVGYPTCHHFDDERLQSEEAASQGSARPQDDALGCNHENQPGDDQAFGSGYSQICPEFYRHSTTSSSDHSGSAIREDASESRPSSWPCGQGESPVRSDRQSPGELPHPDTNGPFRRSASQFDSRNPSRELLGEIVGEYVHVTNVVYTRTDAYYDFTVDEFHNYVMAGVIHHNTGKTLMGMLTVHAHAKGRPYRALILCPDHLIAVWKEELAETIPGATIYSFENWRTVFKFFGSKETSTKHVAGPNESVLDQKRNYWTRPEGPTWVILGRNQAKFDSEWIGIGEGHAGYAGPTPFAGRCRSKKIVSREIKVDESGNSMRDADGEMIKIPVVETWTKCPSCGTVARGPKGFPLTPDDVESKQWTCEGYFLREVPNAESRKSGLDRISGEKHPQFQRFVDRDIEVDHDGKKYTVHSCGERLWNRINKPNRYPPARIIQKKLKGLFRYLVIDEVHEQKSDESAQSMAAGKLMSAVRHTLALTGTVIGGYASHLFPLLARMNPGPIRDEGFVWGDNLEWSKVYGRIDRVITTTESPDGAAEVGRRQVSMRKARKGTRSEKSVIRPGVMPTLYGRHMMGNSVFITLEDMYEELPYFFEYASNSRETRPARESYRNPNKTDEENEAAFQSDLAWWEGWSAGYHEVRVDMDEDQGREYGRIEDELIKANLELIQRGSMKLCGTMLWTLLDYPDKPFGWEPEFEGRHSVGYYDKPRDFSEENWVGVVTPADLGDRIRPKEQALIDICRKEKGQSNQVWVYVNMTGKRDICRRLEKLLADAGLNACVLRSKDVGPKERKEWIDKNGPGYDVIISHPKLVSTGLTLFSKRTGGHNFATLVFYETGYSLFDLRQASRRSWRIGQEKPCKVYYLHYAGTMQDRAMQLMSKKMAAAAALDGEFSAEGLAGLSDGDNAQMALARSLDEQLDENAMRRSWGKIKSGGSKKANRPIIRMGDDLFEDESSEGKQLLVETTAEFTGRFDDEDEYEDYSAWEGPKLPKFSRDQLDQMFAEAYEDEDGIDEFLKAMAEL